MRWVLASIGRAKRDATNILADEYLARLSWPLSEKTAPASKAAQAIARQNEEAVHLLAATAKCDNLIVLDERGANFSSAALAQKLQTMADKRGPLMGCIIGGPDGVSEAVRSKANLLWSFGQLTWPHRLVRVMLFEQLYRAQQILAGHPYHREG